MKLNFKPYLSKLKHSAKTRWHEFGQFDAAKTNSAVAWLSRSKAGVYLLNAAVAGTLVSVETLKKAKSVVTSRSLSTKALEADNSKKEKLIHSSKQLPKVLLIVEPSIPQCFHYRVQQKIDLLEEIGCDSEWFAWSECREKQQRLHMADIIIFYRVPGLPLVLDAINQARQLGKVVIYDIDDLVFDRQIMSEKLASELNLSAKQKRELLTGADLYEQAIRACDYGVASTEALRQKLEPLVKQKSAFLLANGLSSNLVKAVTQPLPEKIANRVTLFYASGTKTHDADFAIISEPLEKLMRGQESVHLVIVGHLNLPDSLTKFSDRIQRLPIMPFEALLQVMRQADIALAPLKVDEFADCKSAIKWLEAAALKIPCVVSGTEEYRTVLKDGKDVLIAENRDQWLSHLESLVTDSKRRTKLANQAFKAAQNVSQVKQAKALQSLLKDVQDHSIEQGVLKASSKNTKRLVLVNTLYPPQALGGATKVVKNITDELLANYPDYDVTVLTAEVVNEGAYTVSEYRHEGINVTVLKVPYRHDLESLAEDSKVETFCLEWFKFKQAEIVHFHSMQHLTASPLVAAKQLNIPYLVTVHDSWWISEHQFMLDARGELVDPKQLNPLVAAQTATDAAVTIQRSHRLAQLLNQANHILAVSNYQQALYQRNGFNVGLNVNGVNAPKEAQPRRNVDKGKLQIAYLGGKSVHKGYDLLKSIFEQNHYVNLNLRVVDLFKDKNFSQPLEWGSNTVELIGKQSMSEITEFYNSIDVLIAPSTWPESFGLVSREAILHGVWVIAADAGGLAEDISIGENGFVFPMRDKERLVGALNDISEGYSHYRDNKPNVDDQLMNIVNVQQQVRELIKYYSN